ncbi:MAG: hypothetical protein K2H87_09195, partial [Duncaniella sp.]|nr:hypothetical protein [Duncaniella sp.]
EGKKKNLWWMDAATGALSYIGQADGKYTYTPSTGDADGVLIAIDSKRDYIKPDQTTLEEAPKPIDTSLLTE